MKTLFLLRHGQAANSAGDDKQRPLTNYGSEQCHHVAKQLMNTSLLPDLILSSTAKRAEQTTLVIKQTLSLPDQAVVWADELYLANLAVLLEQINKQHCSKLLVVGHNPGLEELVLSLCNKVLAGYFGLGTANLVQIEITTEGDVTPGCGKMLNYIQS